MLKKKEKRHNYYRAVLPCNPKGPWTPGSPFSPLVPGIQSLPGTPSFPGVPSLPSLPGRPRGPWIYGRQEDLPIASLLTFSCVGSGLGKTPPVNRHDCMHQSAMTAADIPYLLQLGVHVTH